MTVGTFCTVPLWCAIQCVPSLVKQSVVCFLPGPVFYHSVLQNLVGVNIVTSVHIFHLSIRQNLIYPNLSLECHRCSLGVSQSSSRANEMEVTAPSVDATSTAPMAVVTAASDRSQ
jgi:hypothetical protein